MKNNLDIIGQIIDGNFGEIIVRQKSGREIELGDLFVAENGNEKIILEAFDLVYGSQIGPVYRELISGMHLEGYENLELMDQQIANYTLAKLKALVTIENGIAKTTKRLPQFFSSIRQISEDDVRFLSDEDGFFVGDMRSGSKKLEVTIKISKNALKHHILIPATTGRGKSNLVKVMASSLLKQDSCSLLILDPHDEYYGRNAAGLKDVSDKVIYYSLSPPTGARSLIINISNLRPWHFEGVIDLSPAQIEAMHYYYNMHKEKWIERLFMDEIEKRFVIKPETISVLRRKFTLLGIREAGSAIEAKGVFSTAAGAATIGAICSELESGRSVIIDTSLLSGDLELLAGSMIARELFNNYRRYKTENSLSRKPIISIVIEEAPRVLINNQSIFSTIAREGRKFNIGLIAITQLPSQIPKDILANINTKIILGIELAAERTSIIESASQDLSKDDRNIASLDVGEAIITSNFTKFAVPVKIPLFEAQKSNARRGFAGF